MNDNALNLLGLARRGGNLALGEEPVAQACAQGRAKAVLLASDAGESTARRAARLARRGGAPLLPLSCTKAQLGARMGRACCALAALTDAGLAAAAAQRLAREDESLRPIADALAEKTRRRRRCRGQEKNSPPAGRTPAAG